MCHSLPTIHRFLKSIPLASGPYHWLAMVHTSALHSPAVIVRALDVRRPHKVDSHRVEWENWAAQRMLEVVWIHEVNNFIHSVQHLHNASFCWQIQDRPVNQTSVVLVEIENGFSHKSACSQDPKNPPHKEGMGQATFTIYRQSDEFIAIPDNDWNYAVTCNMIIRKP